MKYTYTVSFKAKNTSIRQKITELIRTLIDTQQQSTTTKLHLTRLRPTGIISDKKTEYSPTLNYLLTIWFETHSRYAATTLDKNIRTMFAVFNEYYSITLDAPTVPPLTKQEIAELEKIVFSGDPIQ